MESTLHLSEEVLYDFVGPETTQRLLQVLSKAQLKKRLLQLSTIYRQLAREAPDLAKETSFNKNYELLKQFPPTVMTHIAGYPSFGQWCATGSTLLTRQAHTNLPDGQIASHLGLLGNFVLAGALMAGLTIELELWLDDRAFLPIPTFHCAIIAPLDLAASRVFCRLEPQYQLAISHQNLSEQQFNIATSADERINVSDTSRFQLRRATMLTELFELNDYDLLLQDDPNFIREERFEWTDSHSRERWRSSMQKAWGLLQSACPAYASQIEKCISVVVPLKSPSTDVHVSCSFSDTYGMVQMSWHEQPSQLAEALVHEYHHNKLNALLDLDPLVDDPFSVARYYSPWRDDPRPLHGLLHGIFAFQSVTHFWRACADINHLSKSLPQAEYEYARRRTQTLAALDSLSSEAKLTKAGRVIVEEIRHQLLALAEPSISSAAQRKIEDDTTEHHLQWELRNSQEPSEKHKELLSTWKTAGGNLRKVSDQAGVEVFEVVAELKDIGDQLGISNGVRVNRIGERQKRLDPTLDILSREFVRDSEQFGQLVNKITNRSAPEAPIYQLLTGHIAYIYGDYAKAAHCYAKCIQITPDNIDIWRDFAFSLGHLQLAEEANIFIFNPTLVVTVAEQIKLETKILDKLLDGDSNLPLYFDVSQPSAQYVLLLRWLKRAVYE